MRDPYACAIAANRFGLGARPGELASIGDDARDWLRAQLLAPPPVLASAQLYPSAQILAEALESVEDGRGLDVGREDEPGPVEDGPDPGRLQLHLGGRQAASPGVVGAQGSSHVVHADVDGRRVRVEGQDEIVLQCGKASITLRRNGKVVVRGTYVETHSDGTNRVKGGQVRIN